MLKHYINLYLKRYVKFLETHLTSFEELMSSRSSSDDKKKKKKSNWYEKDEEKSSRHSKSRDLKDSAFWESKDDFERKVEEETERDVRLLNLDD